MLSAVQKLKNGETFYYQRPQAIFSMTGPDAKDFLERMSTNLVPNDKPLMTSFINSKGRMVDAVVIFQQDGSLKLLSSHEDPNILSEWLERFHFIEDFSLEIDHELSCFYIFGPTDEPAYENFSLDLGGQTVPTYVVLSKNPPEAQKLDHETFETLRIAACIPLAPSEINDGFMPQNINLSKTIAQKGCYIGQEVILKALTYQKNVKQLVGLKLSYEQLSDATGFLSKAPVFYDGLINALVIEQKAAQ